MLRGRRKERVTPSAVGQAVIRNYRPGDEPQWLRLLTASPDFVHDFFNQFPSLDVLRLVVQYPHMDAARNLFFAELGGELVGYAELWRRTGLPRTVARVLVHPDWRRRGLGAALLAQVEMRARTEGGRYLDILVAGEHKAGQGFLEAHGFERVHYGWQMLLPDIRSVPSPTWPSGYSMRTFVPGQDKRTTVAIENLSFQGEWEFVPIELGEVEGFVHSPSFRAEGVLYAMHEGQVVGECWNWIDEEQRHMPLEERSGSVWCLCVHPQHRGRGLGKALLLAGLQWLRQQGATLATL
ncbi:MAG: GNAT family N-acetyltransferase, partial [Chloroflexi bacterium]|nr:GNAT family N-acetyltransferase [Chloroflexota bacterium]